MPVFYDKELDYGSRYYLFITVDHNLIPEGREAGGRLKRHGVYCVRPEGRGGCQGRRGAGGIRLGSGGNSTRSEKTREGKVSSFQNKVYKSTRVNRLQAMIDQD